MLWLAVLSLLSLGAVPISPCIRLGCAISSTVLLPLPDANGFSGGRECFLSGSSRQCSWQEGLFLFPWRGPFPVFVFVSFSKLFVLVWSWSVFKMAQFN